MNNFDRYQDALERDPLEAAKLAIQFSAGCGSRANAWNWADKAVEAARQGGIALDVGQRSWPNTNGMLEQLEGK